MTLLKKMQKIRDEARAIGDHDTEWLIDLAIQNYIGRPLRTHWLTDRVKAELKLDLQEKQVA